MVHSTHSFYTDHAETYGLEEAVILYNLIFWIAKNKANKKHLYPCTINGKSTFRTFTYNTQEAWVVLFKYFKNRLKIQKILARMKNKNIIVTGKYSSNPWDKTTYIGLVDEETLISPIVLNRTMERAKQNNVDCSKQNNHYTDSKPNKKPYTPGHGRKPKKSDVPIEEKNW